MLTTLQIVIIVALSLMFLTTIGGFFKLERYGINFYLFGVMFKTEFFNKVLSKIGEKFKKLWQILFRIGQVLTGIIVVGLLGYFLVNPFLILFDAPGAVGMQLLIPGITIDFKTSLLFIVPILLVIVPHEIGHAVMAKREGIELKSSGIFLFLIFFGAFVELVNESMAKATKKSRIKVLLNGSAINAITTVFFLALYLLSPLIISAGYDETDGVIVTKVFEEFPADLSNIVIGDVIQEMGVVNESESKIIYTRIRSSNDYNVFVYQQVNTSLIYLSLLDGSNISLIPTLTDPISQTNNSEKIYLGITIYNYLPPKAEWFSFWFPYYWSLEVLYCLNLSLMAVFINMLPLVMTDGDKILQEFLNVKGDDANPRHKTILNSLRIFFIGIIILNLVLSMIKF
ncbi:MAG: site-2 protease family protein [Candidatus Heimdallarchaeota archaeon]|nr:site-2 protease family protein [Candidatus Heimdallarchaeota archaeon]